MSDQTCIHDLVAAQASAHPERVALTSAGEQLTYGELDQRAERLADRLAGLGVGPDVPVGVFLERSTEFVATILAILKAGGNYVPLDPNYPRARLELMIERTAPLVIVTTAALAPRLPVSATGVLALEELTGEPDAADRRRRPRVHPDNLAYTMFTSGSTGVPKGVCVRHSGVVRLVRDPDYVRLDERESVLHLSSTSFDAATFEIWGALANGARLVIGPPGNASVLEIAALLREQRVTTAFFTTGLFHLLVDECLEDLSGLRQIVAGGDVMSPSRARRLMRVLPGCRLVNAYGPTEVTTFTTCHVVDAEHDDGYAVPIGRPIDDTWVRVLDENLEPVAAGVPGYLYAGGGGVARGYLGDPALTAERFVPDPWSTGQRLYFTGDLARSLPDGSIEFLGRGDQQVKKRGFRVEPAEIEEALRLDPLLRDAAVVAEGDSAEDRMLVAYVVAASAGIDAGQLLAAVRTHLRDRLPDYLIPDRWAVVDGLELDANGKVDRRALAAAATAREPLDADSAAGELRGAAEIELAAIWRELFKLPAVGRHDDFFELGGHSLLASRMVSRMRSTMGIEVPLTVIFDYPTVAQVAELIERA